MYAVRVFLYIFMAVRIYPQRFPRYMLSYALFMLYPMAAGPRLCVKHLTVRTIAATVVLRLVYGHVIYFFRLTHAGSTLNIMATCCRLSSAKNEPRPFYDYPYEYKKKSHYYYMAV